MHQTVKLVLLFAMDKWRLILTFLALIFINHGDTAAAQMPSYQMFVIDCSAGDFHKVNTQKGIASAIPQIDSKVK